MRITADGWGWRHAGRSEWATRDVSFTLEAGERVLLLGASGSGKSTLLSAIAGVLGGADEGEEAGQLLIDGRHPTRLKGHVGLVQQDPEAQVILARVGDDVAFGLENLRVPPAEIWPLVRASLDRVGLDLPLDHPTSQLSGGQKQRLAIAGALAMQAHDDAPGALLLDEPTANLDPAGVVEVRDTIEAVLADRRATLIVVEHRVDVWADLVDRVIVLGRGGGVLADGPPDAVFGERGPELAAAGAWVPGLPHGVEPRVTPASPGAILTTDDLSIGYSPTQIVRAGLNVDVPRGLATAITGPNGVGKSTLALTLAGLLAPRDGRVIADEQLTAGVRVRKHRNATPSSPISWASRDLLTRIGTVFQEPEHQFVEARVRDEIAVGLKALGWKPDAITARVDDLLGQLHLEKVADANPFTLSGGEKRRLSVGTVLATSPQVIVLDEPTFGQDRVTWISLVTLIQSILDAGSTIISVTHDAAYLDVLAEHRIDLEVAP